MALLHHKLNVNSESNLNHMNGFAGNEF